MLKFVYLMVYLLGLMLAFEYLLELMLVLALGLVKVMVQNFHNPNRNSRKDRRCFSKFDYCVVFDHHSGVLHKI